MPQTDIGQAVASNLKGVVKDYSVNSMITDGPTDQKETTYINQNWSKYLGYYKQIPELRAAIDALATWTVGKGFIADEEVEIFLDTIRGWGKDTFNTILENAIRTYYIGGDAFLEIIRDKDDNILNLKPLDPSTIQIHANRQGLVTKYKQISKVQGNDKTFMPEDIVHFARNRVADEIHGVSVVEALEPIILMRNEAMTDVKKVFHRYVKPFRIFELDTDDSSKISAFKTKMDKITEDTENIYIPKGSVTVEQMGIPQFSSLNPLPWIDNLNDYFFQAVRVPQVIIGSTKFLTEASSKIAYLAFQQTIEEEQLFIQEQVLLQLGIEINLEFPASLENELLSDKKKDGAVNIDANETTAEMEGRK